MHLSDTVYSFCDLGICHKIYHHQVSLCTRLTSVYLFIKEGLKKLCWYIFFVEQAAPVAGLCQKNIIWRTGGDWEDQENWEKRKCSTNTIFFLQVFKQQKPVKTDVCCVVWYWLPGPGTDWSWKTYDWASIIWLSISQRAGSEPYSMLSHFRLQEMV